MVFAFLLQNVQTVLIEVSSCHLTPVRTAIIKNLQTINAEEGVEKREPSCTVGGNVIGTATMENSMEVP